ncbi:hypothetical protein [Cyanobium sp. ATX-6F1]|uniref:hypothetical protein n=1 Tax=Cyanobium sp. ATX-6F1 TaxID=3137388 RepID=UPI0039BDD33B
MRSAATTVCRCCSACWCRTARSWCTASASCWAPWRLRTPVVSTLACSASTTPMWGQEVLPWLHLPRYHVTTLAGAGQFLQLEAISRPVERK